MIRFRKNPEELARAIYEDYYRKKNNHNLPRDPVFGSIDEKDAIFLATRMDDENERIYGFLGRGDGFSDLNEFGWQVQRWIWVSYPSVGAVQMMKTHVDIDFYDNKWWSPDLPVLEKERFISQLAMVIDFKLLYLDP